MLKNPIPHFSPSFFLREFDTQVFVLLTITPPKPPPPKEATHTKPSAHGPYDAPRICPQYSPFFLFGSHAPGLGGEGAHHKPAWHLPKGCKTPPPQVSPSFFFAVLFSNLVPATSQVPGLSA